MLRLHPMVGVLAGVGLMATFVTTFIAAAHADDTPTPNEQITVAIKKAIAWIYQQQNSWGTWETATEPAGIERDLPDQGQFGLKTALALHTLLVAGESDREPRLQKAIDFLITSDRISGVYAVGMRAQVWPLIAPSPAIRQAMARDRNILLSAIHAQGKTKGLFSFRTDYDHEPEYADHSVSFYGSLGMAALSDAGIEVPDSFWKSADHAWRSQQSRDGSWVYQVGKAGVQQEHTMSMTASGVAVLLSMTDQLSASGSGDCQGPPTDRNIESGLNWIDTHFDQSRDPHEIMGFKLLNYALYAVSQIGEISGRKYFNQRDWYQDGAHMLLDSQESPSGSWANLPDTCFAVLFLDQGRDPVVMSKLQYKSGGGPRVPAAKPPAQRPSARNYRGSSWNLRPRDVANFTDWLGHQAERNYNWETVNLAVPVEELHDSAVLYITGNQALNLATEDKQKLKTFVQEGGLLLGNADCASKEFSDSFRKLGVELFPEYEFRNVPRDSVILTSQQYLAGKWKEFPQVLELNNGIRDLMLLIPQDDPSRFFQRRQVGSREYLYELMTDIVFYAVDHNGMRMKGDTYLVRPDPNARIQRSVKIARLQYNGNWDPEPGGWVREAAVMHNTRGIDLQVTSVRLGEGKLDASFKMAHLTGTAAFHLSEVSRKEIASFVQHGGTLVIDAGGGSAAFDAAAQTEIKAIFPNANLDLLASDHPVFSAGETLTRASYRRFTRSRTGQNTDFRLQGLDESGRTAVFYSAEDISEGLVGEPVDGIYGYRARIAASLMANLITYSIGN